MTAREDRLMDGWMDRRDREKEGQRVRGREGERERWELFIRRFALHPPLSHLMTSRVTLLHTLFFNTEVVAYCLSIWSALHNVAIKHRQFAFLMTAHTCRTEQLNTAQDF